MSRGLSSSATAPSLTSPLTTELVTPAISASSDSVKASPP